MHASGSKGAKRTYVMVTDLDANNVNANTRLIFRNVGDKRILAEVWAKGLDHGHMLGNPAPGTASTTVLATKK